jgi:hypothetical protein
VDGGMYGFPQAGRIAHRYLVDEVLGPAGYIQDPMVPCLFRHVDNGVVFTLIKFPKNSNADHLLSTLRSKYDITVDESGHKYLRMTIDIDRDIGVLSLSMPGYVAKALKRFHKGPIKGAASPAVYSSPSYGSTKQYTAVDRSPNLSSDNVTRLQEIIGVFLYYARAIDAVTALASSQSNPTEKVMADAERLLAYAAAHPDHMLIRLCTAAYL